MDVLTLIKHSFVTDNSNPITKHFHLGSQTASGGPEMVWKVFEATRIKDKAVSLYIELYNYWNIVSCLETSPLLNKMYCKHSTGFIFLSICLFVLGGLCLSF